MNHIVTALCGALHLKAPSHLRAHPQSLLVYHLHRDDKWVGPPSHPNMLWVIECDSSLLGGAVHLDIRSFYGEYFLENIARGHYKQNHHHQVSGPRDPSKHREVVAISSGN